MVRNSKMKNMNIHNNADKTNMFNALDDVYKAYKENENIITESNILSPVKTKCKCNKWFPNDRILHHMIK